ncbi:hypothetical protein ACFCVO_06955 [Agromyces sp. NPDC056379]|uniref:hypothetical protein n=1 Tax=unclassified Agromyces TaxID=2639701 RepID=UPI0035D63F48
MTEDKRVDGRGWATLRGERVTVSGWPESTSLKVTAEREVLEGFDPTPADVTYGYSREPWASAEVPVEALSHLVLTETRERAASAVTADDVGVFGVIGSTSVRLGDTVGFVFQGEPRLRVECDEVEPPVGFAWTRNASGWSADVPRSAITAVERRIIFASWRGAKVRVARVDGDTAIVYSERIVYTDAYAPFEAAEMDAIDDMKAGWSARVRVGDLEPARATRSTSPLVPAHFPLAVGRVGERAEQVGLLEADGVLRSDLAAVVRPVVDMPDPLMSLYGLDFVPRPQREWRRFVPSGEIEAPELVVTEARVDGAWNPVGRIDADSWRVFGTDLEEIRLDTIEAYRYTSSTVGLESAPRVRTRKAYLEARGL